MADTCHEQVLAALEDLLKTLDPGVAVERERDRPLDEDDLSILVVYEEAEDPQDDLTGERGYVLRVSIQGAVRGTDLAAARREADSLRGRVDDLLLAPAAAHAIHAQDIRLSAEPAAERFDLPTEATSYGFIRVVEIDYATLEHDAFTFA